MSKPREKLPRLVFELGGKKLTMFSREEDLKHLQEQLTQMTDKLSASNYIIGVKRKQTQELEEKVTKLSEEVSTVRRRNKELDWQVSKLKMEIVDREEVRYKQKCLIDKYKMRNAQLTERVVNHMSTVVTDKEAYDWFKLEYNILDNNLSELKEKICFLKKKHEELKYKHITATMGNIRLSTSVQIEAVEHEISSKQTKYKELLSQLKTSTIFNDLFEKQSDQVKSTLTKLGWLYSDVTFEYRIGILYDAARIHSCRSLLALADHIVKSNIQIVEKSKQACSPFIPVRSMLMRSSLCHDSKTKSMSKKNILPSDFPDQFLKDITLSADVDPDVKFPKLPTLESLLTKLNVDIEDINQSSSDHYREYDSLSDDCDSEICP